MMVLINFEDGCDPSVDKKSLPIKGLALTHQSQ